MKLSEFNEKPDQVEQLVFQMINKYTDCLAKDVCIAPKQHHRLLEPRLADFCLPASCC